MNLGFRTQLSKAQGTGWAIWLPALGRGISVFVTAPLMATHLVFRYISFSAAAVIAFLVIRHYYARQQEALIRMCSIADVSHHPLPCHAVGSHEK